MGKLDVTPLLPPTISTMSEAKIVCPAVLVPPERPLTKSHISNVDIPIGGVGEQHVIFSVDGVTGSKLDSISIFEGGGQVRSISQATDRVQHEVGREVDCILGTDQLRGRCAICKTEALTVDQPAIGVAATGPCVGIEGQRVVTDPLHDKRAGVGPDGCHVGTGGGSDRSAGGGSGAVRNTQNPGRLRHYHW